MFFRKNVCYAWVMNLADLPHMKPNVIEKMLWLQLWGMKLLIWREPFNQMVVSGTQAYTLHEIIGIVPYSGHPQSVHEGPKDSRENKTN